MVHGNQFCSKFAQNTNRIHPSEHRKTSVCRNADTDDLSIMTNKLSSVYMVDVYGNVCEV